MTPDWMDVVLVFGAQHLWQSAAWLLLAWLALRLWPLNAEARSWLWLGVFVLAAVSPLAVWLPAGESAAANAPIVDATAIPMVDSVPVGSAAAVIGHEASENGSIFDAVFPLLASAAPLAWLLGIVWSLGRLWLAWFTARRLRDRARSAPYLERLLSRRLPANAQVKVSDGITGPMVVGLACPCILVPRKLVSELPEPALQHVLDHEIAHIRRRDLWVSLVQNLLAACYWWSPALKLIGKRLELTREMACDERAAVDSGGGRTYAQSLLTSAERLLSFSQPRRLLAVGIFDTRSDLGRRIEGLLDMDARPLRSGIKHALAVGAVTLAAGATLTLAATPRLGASSPTASANLVTAVKAGRLDEVQRLIRAGADIDAPAVGDGTALIAAARAGDARMATALLRMGADVNRPSRGDGNPLIMAAMAGHRDVVALLVAAGAEVNAVVPYDETPLINAAREGHLPIVQYLVEHGADVNLGVHADYGRWRSPLNQARDGRVREYLVGKGAVPGNRDRNAPSTDL